MRCGTRGSTLIRRVVGTTVDLNKQPFTIIGVAPRGFHGTEIFFWPEFWVPMVNEQQVEGYNFLTKRGNHGLFVIGSLKPGVTPRQAEDNLIAVAHQMTRENPTDDDGLTVRLVKPGLLGDALGGPAKPFLAAIMGLALLVLLAACVNLAGIFAARAADRSRELAIRLSIGSTRWRILRQLLTEAMVVSLAGGALGTLIATAMLKFLSHWQPISEYPIHVTVVADGRDLLDRRAVFRLRRNSAGAFAGAASVADGRYGRHEERDDFGENPAPSHVARFAVGDTNRVVRAAVDIVDGGIARHGALAARAHGVCAAGGDGSPRLICRWRATPMTLHFRFSDA